MKTLFEILKINLEKDYKNVDEMFNDATNIDMKKMIETVYQYILYQEQINQINPSAIKVAMNILKEQKNNVHNAANN